MRIFLVMFLLLFFSQSFGQNSSVDSLLQYDDGLEPITPLTMTVHTINFITRFTPPSVPAQVVKVRYYVPDTTGGSGFILRIMQYVGASVEPGIVLYGPVNIPSSRPGWNELDLSEKNIFTENDFNVWMQYDGKSKLTLGAENREPLSMRTYDTDC